MADQLLTKTLRDGREFTLTIEPDPGRGQDPDQALAYHLRTHVDGETSTAFSAASPFELTEPPAPGVTCAIRVILPGSMEWKPVGLTAAEASQVKEATARWIQARKDRRSAQRDALADRVRAAAPGAPAFTISSPDGAPAGIGETVRDRDGRAVTGLRTWRKHYPEDGWSFGVMAESGYLYFSEVRGATPGEREELEEREELRARREQLAARGAELARTADGEVPAEVAEDLHALPSVRVRPARRTETGTPCEHLRLDEPGGALWVLTYNGHDGDNWSASNYNRAYIARRVPLTPELAALAAGLRAEFGSAD